VQVGGSERCEFIRWKGLFVDISQRDANEPESTEPHIYWCVQTQNCLGPDGQVVDEEVCNSFRSCYRPL